jgi:hypothetical protein
MYLTRIIIGLATGIFVTIPLVGLAKLSYDIRYSFFGRIYDDVVFPKLSSLLWVFGPLDWWSFITPLALAVAVAASIGAPMRRSTLTLIFGSAVLQALALMASGIPYFKFTNVMGYPIPSPYPIECIIANITLVGTSVGLALYSLARAYARAQSPIS